jgi:hypothetical protein
MTGVLSLGVWGGVAGRRAGLIGWPLVLSIAFGLVRGLETPAMSTIKTAAAGLPPAGIRHVRIKLAEPDRCPDQLADGCRTSPVHRTRRPSAALTRTALSLIKGPGSTRPGGACPHSAAGIRAPASHQSDGTISASFGFRRLSCSIVRAGPRRR